jgi:hypothetical protein
VLADLAAAPREIVAFGGLPLKAGIGDARHCARLDNYWGDNGASDLSRRASANRRSMTFLECYKRNKPSAGVARDLNAVTEHRPNAARTYHTIAVMA